MPDPLTPAELRALVAFAMAGGEREAADSLGLSRHTVRHHLESCRRKLGAASTAQAFYFAVRDGLVRVRGEAA